MLLLTRLKKNFAAYTTAAALGLFALGGWFIYNKISCDEVEKPIVAHTAQIDDYSGLELESITYEDNFSAQDAPELDQESLFENPESTVDTIEDMIRQVQTQSNPDGEAPQAALLSEFTPESLREYLESKNITIPAFLISAWSNAIEGYLQVNDESMRSMLTLIGFLDYLPERAKLDPSQTCLAVNLDESDFPVIQQYLDQILNEYFGFGSSRTNIQDKIRVMTDLYDRISTPSERYESIFDYSSHSQAYMDEIVRSMRQDASDFSESTDDQEFIDADLWISRLYGSYRVTDAARAVGAELLETDPDLVELLFDRARRHYTGRLATAQQEDYSEMVQQCQREIELYRSQIQDSEYPDEISRLQEILEIKEEYLANLQNGTIRARRIAEAERGLRVFDTIHDRLFNGDE